MRRRVLGQPGKLEAVVDAVGETLAAAVPPGRRDLVLFTGMGASHFAAMPAAGALRRAGTTAFAIEAADLEGFAGGERAQLVAVSNSGRSPETLAAVTGHDGPTLAITNDDANPLADAAGAGVLLGLAPEPAISVESYTASVVAAAMVAAALDERMTPMAHAIPEAAAQVIEHSSEPCARAAERFAGARAFDFIGDGTAAATAGEGALLFREACRRPAAWWTLRGYLHGPVEAAQTDIAHVVAGRGRAVALARDLARYGAQVLLLTTDHDVADPAVDVVRIPGVHPALSPVLEMLSVQLLVAALCERWQISSDGFRNPQPDTRLP